MQITNMLEEIKAYQLKLGYDYKYESIEDRVQHIRELTLAQMVEVTEFLDWLPWKPWRDTKSQTCNSNEAALELIDQFFFMANLWAAIGKQPEDFEKLFKQKLEENYSRIERGYNKTCQNDENKQGELPL